MNEHHNHQIPLSSPFDSAFCNFMEPIASPCGSHGSASPSWPFVDSQKTTHYDATSQYLAEGGCASVAGMQDVVTGASDFPGSLHVDTGSTYMDEFMGSSFQTDLLDANMLDDCQYQDLLRRAGLSYSGQFENTKNKSQTSCSVRDLRLTTGVPLLENYALAQNHTSRTKEVNGNSVHVIRSHLKPSKAASCFDSNRSRVKVSREELNARDNARLLANERRCRITKCIQDLEKLLPQPARNQPEVMDKSIEYINHLQLQLKELSQNRLRSEGDTDPLISLKGFRIHLPAQLFLEEFKDILGRLLKENPAAAKKLLESHGLLMVPSALVKALRQKE